MKTALDNYSQNRAKLSAKFRNQWILWIFVIILSQSLDSVVTKVCLVSSGSKENSACPDALDIGGQLESVLSLPSTLESGACRASELFGVDRTFIINLDRRTDKVHIQNTRSKNSFSSAIQIKRRPRQWATMASRLAAAGFSNYERFPAVDGRTLPLVSSAPDASDTLERTAYGLKQPQQSRSTSTAAVTKHHG